MRRSLALVLACGLCAGGLCGEASGQAIGQALAPVAATVAMEDHADVAWIEIKGEPADGPGPLDWLFPSDEPTLQQLVDGLNTIAAEEKFKAVLIRLKDATLGATQVEELSSAMRKVRDAGIKVYVFAESFSGADFMLAAAADKVMCQSGGAVEFMGISMEEMYLADTMAWAGLKADMVQVGAYKGANEQMVNSRPSPQWESNINQLLDSMYANMRQPILSGRHLSESQLDEAMSNLWMGSAQEAKDAKLIDETVDLPLLTEVLSSELGSPVKINTKTLSLQDGGGLELSNPFTFLQELGRDPEVTPDGPSIAVLHVDGAIVDGDSSMGGFSGEVTVGSRTIRNAIEDMLAEDLIKGVVVRIDSPGGSATASEVIWQGLQRLSEKKPVWVSVGSMAASGGYYLAVAGGKIYVNPSSIVGSIGVVGGKISMQGLFDHLKVNVVSRSRGPQGDLFGVAPWTPKQLELVRTKMTSTYNLFTSRVTAGREGIDLAKTAEGRLFTGDKAIGLRMADEIGGLSDAIDALGEEVGLDEPSVVHYPAPKSLPDFLEDLFGGVSAQSGLKALPVSGTFQIAALGRELLGEHRWTQVARHMDAFMQLREQPVILLNPKVIIVK